ncbi:hypothetical protein D3C71_1624040 [compost metagenome]
MRWSGRDGISTRTSTPRSTAKRNAANTASSGMKYGLVIHTRRVAEWIASRKNSEQVSCGSAGPLAKAWHSTPLSG